MKRECVWDVRITSRERCSRFIVFLNLYTEEVLKQTRDVLFHVCCKHKRFLLKCNKGFYWIKDESLQFYFNNLKKGCFYFTWCRIHVCSGRHVSLHVVMICDIISLVTVAVASSCWSQICQCHTVTNIKLSLIYYTERPGPDQVQTGSRPSSMSLFQCLLHCITFCQ